MPNLYIISGCNGAGKTTASFTILPEMLDCQEFINADEIARGLSPFNPDKSAIEAGRIMISKIDRLISLKETFAVETTLATKIYLNIIKKAKENGFKVILIYFWLDSVNLAKERVKSRVLEGGHNIPEQTIERRYHLGIQHLVNLYTSICDYWMIFNNSTPSSQLIAEGSFNNRIEIKNHTIFNKINSVNI